MKFKFLNKKITGILTILPENEVKFEDEIENYNFSVSQSMKLKKVMGFDRHRIVKEGVCSSDLATFGLQYLFENSLLKKEEIDGLLLVTTSPDYIMPPTSNIIQEKFGLKRDMICLDINQACCGFIVGLLQAFMMLDQEEINKVVLINADATSRKVSKRDRNMYPIVGDAASVTVIESVKDSKPIYLSLKMDASGVYDLIIPAGGFRIPSTAETAIMKEDESGNFRSLDNLVMKGDNVFNFVLREVPPMIEEILDFSNTRSEDVDFYLCHQPNKFIVNKIADKIGVLREKVPSNIVEKYGNSNGVTIPVTISDNIGQELEHKSFNVCLAGFGAGFTFGAAILELGNLDFNRIIEF
jgi:3-oxoacyl-[acyl-carrier-protein] synthase III